MEHELHSFHALNIQSMLEIFQLIHDFITIVNKIRSSIYIFLIVSNKGSFLNG